MSCYLPLSSVAELEKYGFTKDAPVQGLRIVKSISLLEDAREETLYFPVVKRCAPDLSLAKVECTLSGTGVLEPKTKDPSFLKYFVTARAVPVVEQPKIAITIHRFEPIANLPIANIHIADLPIADLPIEEHSLVKDVDDDVIMDDFTYFDITGYVEPKLEPLKRCTLCDKKEPIDVDSIIPCQKGLCDKYVGYCSTCWQKLLLKAATKWDFEHHRDKRYDRCCPHPRHGQEFACLYHLDKTPDNKAINDTVNYYQGQVADNLYLMHLCKKHNKKLL
jgi:hypothetical protein